MPHAFLILAIAFAATGITGSLMLKDSRHIKSTELDITDYGGNFKTFFSIKFFIVNERRKEK